MATTEAKTDQVKTEAKPEAKEVEENSEPLKYKVPIKHSFLRTCIYINLLLLFFFLILTCF